MTNIDYSLSLSNAKRINLDKYEKDFIFNVNGKQYKTPRFVADILSPLINEYHYNDESINEFTINIKQDENSTDYFKDFLELHNFELNNIDEARRKQYCEYFLELGNIDEYLRLQPEMTKDLTINNIFDRLTKISQIINKYQILMNDQLKALIKFASSHFYELDKEKMKKLDFFIIKEIIENEEFKIDEEDTLLRFIIEKYEEDTQYCELFEDVIFNNVSEKTVEEFINVFSIEHLNLNLWKSICERFVGSKKNDKIKHKERYICRENIIEMKHKEGDEFNGIMKYLTKMTGGNIHDNGTIEISSNSIVDNNNSYHPKNLVDFENTNYYHSKNEQDVNICFDFKDKSIQMTNYSIKSYDRGQTGGHLRNWVVEVSNDKEHWEIVDQHDNDSILRSANAIKTFNTKQTESFYQFIRLRQTGTSWHNNDNNYYLYFPFFEIYGKLKQPKQKSDK